MSTADSPIRLDTDVVIVGARLAGAATAMLLARRGHRVVVLDRAPPGTDTMSTHALMKAGVFQLHRWGLLDRLVAAGTPAIRRTVIHYGDDQVTIPVKPSGPVEALYAPRRTVLDPLVAAAAAEAGADIRFGVTVRDLRRDGSGRVTGVTGRDATGRPIEVVAPMTVGADGVHSVVARTVQAATYRVGSSASALVYSHFADVPDEGYGWFYRPGVAAGIIPTDGGETCAWAGLPAGRFATDVRPDVEAGFWRTLTAAAPEMVDRLANGRRTSPWRSFPGQAGYFRQSWGPGWALVGDAGHFKDPLGAHGMTDALRDAELLADAVNGGADGQGGRHDALAAYQDIRDGLSERFFTAVDAVASYRWSLDELRGLLIELSHAMSDEVAAITRLGDHAMTAA